MTVDVEQASRSFGQYISALPDLSVHFSINSPLPSSYIEDTPLSEWYTTTLSKFGGASASHVFELSAKNLMYQYVHESTEISNSIVLLGTLLDITISLVRLGKVDHTLPLLLVEEMFEIQTIGWCQEFWPYMVSRENTLTSNLTGTRAPGTTLIRLCNALLRRLSKTQNAQFSGEIAIFLARAFPLTEKSGLNIRGSFNTENVTFYEGDGTIELDNDAMDTEDDVMYRKFWSLQKNFSNPVELITSPEALSEFKENVTEVLSELKRREAAHNTKRDRENEQRRMDIDLEDDEEEGVFVPKWLTRRDLFELQLKDVTFRRSILTQASITVDFLLGLSEKAKAKWGADQIAATNKSVMFGFTLTPEDEAYFVNMQKSFQRTTFTSVDFDSAYLRTINTIMQRDRYWQEWKLKNCPSFEMPPLPSEELSNAKHKLENTLTKPRRKFWHAMGTAPLTKIWKIKTGLESLKSPKRYSIPEAKTYYEKIKDETERFVIEHTIEVPEEPNAPKEKEENEKESEKSEVKENPEADTDMESTAGEKKDLPAPTLVKKLVVSKQEQRQFNEETGSKTWRGLRAARSQGYWAKFGLVTKEVGFSGLFETPTSKFASLQVPPRVNQELNASSPVLPNEASSTPATPGMEAIGTKRSEPEDSSPEGDTRESTEESASKKQKVV